MAENKKYAPLEDPIGYWDFVWSKFRHDDKKSYLIAMADRINSREYWDNLWQRPSRRVEKYSMQRAWWVMQQEKPKSVLDAGCGNGRLLYGVKRFAPETRLFGIDISQVAINRMMKEYGVEGAVMDVYDVHLLPEQFDFIVANHMLEHLYRDEEFVQKCKERMNDGGTFYAAVPNDMSGPEETEEHVRKYDSTTLSSLLGGVFGNCKIETIGNHLIGISKK